MVSADGLPLHVRLELADTTPKAFPAETEGAALFFVSEALANVLKHARASTVVVRLAVDAQGLRLEVEDDGVGGVDQRGTGISGLGDRVAATGGQVDVESTPGRSRIAATFPTGAG